MNDLPSPEDFFLTVPLYEKYLFSGEVIFDVVDILYFNNVIDTYCPSCKRSATFRGINASVPHNLIRRRGLIEGAMSGEYPKIDIGPRHIIFQCTRNIDHLIDFIVHIDQQLIDGLIVHSIQKIGQYPSYADLNIPQIAQYSLVLSPQDRQEFARAEGLAAHGIGVGSLIYLRRIFERLIEEAHQEASLSAGWSPEQEDELIKSRMDERIRILRDYLPEFVVMHAKMYGLLSKGVHEYSEDECLRHFDAVKIAIEYILHRKNEKKLEEKKQKEASLAIDQAIGQLKDSK